ncbi:Ribosome-binding protein 1 [Smittium culicis]|uniref:Ribosome-binding protein 1 n=1 Tax=Smittium culicis TaxID=133412 RepID=A0A1R1YFI2_9FUNG|nr:Ribosome-binding protein 1 [Smittium culicis]
MQNALYLALNIAKNHTKYLNPSQSQNYITNQGQLNNYNPPQNPKNTHLQDSHNSQTNIQNNSPIQNLFSSSSRGQTEFQQPVHLNSQQKNLSQYIPGSQNQNTNRNKNPSNFGFKSQEYLFPAPKSQNTFQSNSQTFNNHQKNPAIFAENQKRSEEISQIKSQNIPLSHITSNKYFIPQGNNIPMNHGQNLSKNNPSPNDLPSSQRINQSQRQIDYQTHAQHMYQPHLQPSEAFNSQNQNTYTQSQIYTHGQPLNQLHVQPVFQSANQSQIQRIDIAQNQKNDQPQAHTSSKVHLQTNELAQTVRNEQAQILRKEQAQILRNDQAQAQAIRSEHAQAQAIRNEHAQAQAIRNEQAQTLRNEQAQAQAIVNEQAQTLRNEQAQAQAIRSEHAQAQAIRNEHAQAQAIRNEQAQTLRNEQAQTLRNEQAQTLRNEQAQAMTLRNEQAQALRNKQAQDLANRNEQTQTLINKQAQALRNEQAQAQAIRSEQAQTLRNEQAQAQTLRNEQAQAQTLRNEQAQAQAIRNEQAQALRNKQAQDLANRNEQTQTLINKQAQALRNEQAQAQAIRNEQAQAQAIRSEQAQTLRNDQAQAQTLRNEQAQAQTLRNEQAQAQAIRNEQAQAQAIRNEQAQAQAIRNEQAQAQNLRNEQAQAQAIRNEQTQTLINKQSQAQTLRNEHAQTLRIEQAQTLRNEQAQTLRNEQAQTLRNEQAQAQAIRNEQAQVQAIRNEQAQAQAQAIRNEKTQTQVLKNEQVQTQGLKNDQHQNQKLFQTLIQNFYQARRQSTENSANQNNFLSQPQSQSNGIIEDQISNQPHKNIQSDQLNQLNIEPIPIINMKRSRISDSNLSRDSQHLNKLNQRIGYESGTQSRKYISKNNDQENKYKSLNTHETNHIHITNQNLSQTQSQDIDVNISRDYEVIAHQKQAQSYSQSIKNDSYPEINHPLEPGVPEKHLSQQKKVEKRKLDSDFVAATNDEMLSRRLRTEQNLPNANIPIQGISFSKNSLSQNSRKSSPNNEHSDIIIFSSPLKQKNEMTNIEISKPCTLNKKKDFNNTESDHSGSNFPGFWNTGVTVIKFDSSIQGVPISLNPKKPASNFDDLKSKTPSPSIEPSKVQPGAELTKSSRYATSEISSTYLHSDKPVSRFNTIVQNENESSRRSMAIEPSIENSNIPKVDSRNLIQKTFIKLVDKTSSHFKKPDSENLRDKRLLENFDKNTLNFEPKGKNFTQNSKFNQEPKISHLNEPKVKNTFNSEMSARDSNISTQINIGDTGNYIQTRFKPSTALDKISYVLKNSPDINTIVQFQKNKNLPSNKSASTSFNPLVDNISKTVPKASKNGNVAEIVIAESILIPTASSTYEINTQNTPTHNSHVLPFKPLEEKLEPNKGSSNILHAKKRSYLTDIESRFSKSPTLEEVAEFYSKTRARSESPSISKIQKRSSPLTRKFLAHSNSSTDLKSETERLSSSLTSHNKQVSIDSDTSSSHLNASQPSIELKSSSLVSAHLPEKDNQDKFKPINHSLTALPQSSLPNISNSQLSPKDIKSVPEYEKPINNYYSDKASYSKSEISDLSNSPTFNSNRISPLSSMGMNLESTHKLAQIKQGKDPLPSHQNISIQETHLISLTDSNNLNTSLPHSSHNSKYHTFSKQEDFNQIKGVSRSLSYKNQILYDNIDNVKGIPTKKHSISDTTASPQPYNKPLIGKSHSEFAKQQLIDASYVDMPSISKSSNIKGVNTVIKSQPSPLQTNPPLAIEVNTLSTKSKDLEILNNPVKIKGISSPVKIDEKSNLTNEIKPAHTYGNLSNATTTNKLDNFEITKLIHDRLTNKSFPVKNDNIQHDLSTKTINTQTDNKSSLSSPPLTHSYSTKDNPNFMENVPYTKKHSFPSNSDVPLQPIIGPSSIPELNLEFISTDKSTHILDPQSSKRQLEPQKIFNSNNKFDTENTKIFEFDSTARHSLQVKELEPHALPENTVLADKNPKIQINSQSLINECQPISLKCSNISNVDILPLALQKSKTYNTQTSISSSLSKNDNVSLGKSAKPNITLSSDESLHFVAKNSVKNSTTAKSQAPFNNSSKESKNLNQNKLANISDSIEIVSKETKSKESFDKVTPKTTIFPISFTGSKNITDDSLKVGSDGIINSIYNIVMKTISLNESSIQSNTHVSKKSSSSIGHKQKPSKDYSQSTKPIAPVSYKPSINDIKSSEFLDKSVITTPTQKPKESNLGTNGNNLSLIEQDIASFKKSNNQTTELKTPSIKSPDSESPNDLNTLKETTKTIEKKDPVLSAPVESVRQANSNSLKRKSDFLSSNTSPSKKNASSNSKPNNNNIKTTPSLSNNKISQLDTNINISLNFPGSNKSQPLCNSEHIRPHELDYGKVQKTPLNESKVEENTLNSSQKPKSKKNLNKATPNNIPAKVFEKITPNVVNPNIKYTPTSTKSISSFPTSSLDASGSACIGNPKEKFTKPTKNVSASDNTKPNATNSSTPSFLEKIISNVSKSKLLDQSLQASPDSLVKKLPSYTKSLNSYGKNDFLNKPVEASLYMNSKTGKPPYLTPSVSRPSGDTRTVINSNINKSRQNSTSKKNNKTPQGKKNDDSQDSSAVGIKCNSQAPNSGSKAHVNGIISINQFDITPSKNTHSNKSDNLSNHSSLPKILGKSDLLKNNTKITSSLSNHTAKPSENQTNKPNLLSNNEKKGSGTLSSDTPIEFNSPPLQQQKLNNTIPSENSAIHTNDFQSLDNKKNKNPNKSINKNKNSEGKNNYRNGYVSDELIYAYHIYSLHYPRTEKRKTFEFFQKFYDPYMDLTTIRKLQQLDIPDARVNEIISSLHKKYSDHRFSFLQSTLINWINQRTYEYNKLKLENKIKKNNHQGSNKPITEEDIDNYCDDQLELSSKNNSDLEKMPILFNDFSHVKNNKHFSSEHKANAVMGSYMVWLNQSLSRMVIRFFDNNKRGIHSSHQKYRFFITYFQTKYNLSIWKMCVLYNNKATNSVTYVNSAPGSNCPIRNKIKNYDPRLIFSVEETGIFYRAHHNFIVADRQVNQSVTENERLALIVCTNSVATKKMPIWVVGNKILAQDQNFVDFKNNVVNYRYNFKSQITPHIFIEWIKWFDDSMGDYLKSNSKNTVNSKKKTQENENLQNDSSLQLNKGIENISSDEICDIKIDCTINNQSSDKSNINNESLNDRDDQNYKINSTKELSNSFNTSKIKNKVILILRSNSLHRFRYVNFLKNTEVIVIPSNDNKWILPFESGISKLFRVCYRTVVIDIIKDITAHKRKARKNNSEVDSVLKPEIFLSAKGTSYNVKILNENSLKLGMHKRHTEDPNMTSISLESCMIAMSYAWEVKVPNIYILGCFNSMVLNSRHSLKEQIGFLSQNNKTMVRAQGELISGLNRLKSVYYKHFIDYEFSILEQDVIYEQKVFIHYDVVKGEGKLKKLINGKKKSILYAQEHANSKSKGDQKNPSDSISGSSKNTHIESHSEISSFNNPSTEMIMRDVIEILDDSDEDNANFKTVVKNAPTEVKEPPASIVTYSNINELVDISQDSENIDILDQSQKITDDSGIDNSLEFEELEEPSMFDLMSNQLPDKPDKSAKVTSNYEITKFKAVNSVNRRVYNKLQAREKSKINHYLALARLNEIQRIICEFENGEAYFYDFDADKLLYNDNIYPEAKHFSKEFE